MKYLLDTSVILELLLDQSSADSVQRFLMGAPKGSLHISEFALYSIGILLFRRKEQDVFLQAVNDLLVVGGVGLIRLDVKEMDEIAEISKRVGLDFDDAYQYTAAEKYKLVLVSFDKHFDRTDIGRKTPEEILRSSH